MPASIHAHARRHARRRAGLRPAIAALVALIAVLGACAGPSPTPTASPSPTATPTPSPSPSPTVAASPLPSGLAISDTARAYLVDLAGYEYEALPASAEQQMAAGFAGNAAITAAIRGYAATSVTQAASPVAVVLVLEMDPAIANAAGMMAGFWGGAAGSLNAPATTDTIGGKEVRVIDGATSKVVGWQADTLVVMVFGQTMPPVKAVSQALITAHG